ncbi:hypothetical protein [Reyranella sp.]|uniref:hypothetical protein n=1 Tax=Reyranella sp. TaxID=1929291 RepID=UPI000BD45540|nr:hypothetical protein [Reyranella sp.]OYY40612.1 MAG: hypothetical protein B7Y57_16295 [Rhodospirillales bacterium 35-66-84]OYZ93172.1 MAG: hypothetical protein B7Y08_17540 [Rhodospirillales bacterium 24-66-33]OZB24592.1 MAG: hypothetical protein B7X63_15540 [Rhodospirillales bacterium 39-66-50]HQS18114.1 hypothetical protein [Reyranella sp.]HQT14689.1 hypothetical protein [Reyranella sp.]
MRYQVLPATSADVAYVASLLEDEPAAADWPEKEPSRRLVEACAFSAQIWAARRLSDGATSALWGVTPRLDNPEVGYLWMMSVAAFDGESREFSMLCRLVFAEMLDQFPRLEQHIDAREDRTIGLLRGLGFEIGKPQRQLGSATTFHHVWLESQSFSRYSNQPGAGAPLVH